LQVSKKVVILQPISKGNKQNKNINEMKKLVLAIAIVLGMGIGAYAQGGMFKYGDEPEQTRDGAMNVPGLPNHGEEGNQPAPLAGGALLLIGFGAAYAMKKRNEK
jgi:LPXTG-motif cell wall-anchored protein